MNYSMFWKLIYDKAKVALDGEDPWLKHCQCGTMMSFFTQNGTNRPITGDPGSQNVRKARYSIKMWKGLYGDNAPAVSDHISNFGRRSKGLMAAGYVMETRAWTPTDQDYGATHQKFFNLAKDEGLAKGLFMDEYKFGFDFPEGLAYARADKNTTYYSFFASNAPVAGFSTGATQNGGGETTMRYEGPVELRGLEPGNTYRIIDYSDGSIDKTFVADEKGIITLNVSFTECILLKAVLPPNTIDDGAIKVEIGDDMSMTVFQNDGTANNPEWIQVTKPIDKLGEDGATATGVVGAWKDALPWSVNTGTGSTNFLEESAKILSAKSSYITTGAPNRILPSGQTGVTGGTDAGERLLSDSFVKTNQLYETNVKTYYSGEGVGQRLTVEGTDSALGLKHTLVLETGAVPGTVAVSSYYTYLNEGELTVTKFVDNNFKLEASPLERLIMNDERGNPDTKRPETGLWSWQGCDVSGSQIEHTVAPVLDTMGTMSFGSTIHSTGAGHTMSRNNWNWTVRAGVAYNYFWGRTLGLA